nr:YbdD/YjiX family protein [Rhodomicrobium sp. Az07]
MSPFSKGSKSNLCLRPARDVAGEPVMSWEEFFKERQDARYKGKGRFRCC